MSIWGEKVHIKLLVFQEVLSLTKTLKGTKQTKRDEPHKKDRPKKYMWRKGKNKHGQGQSPPQVT